MRNACVSVCVYVREEGEEEQEESLKPSKRELPHKYTSTPQLIFIHSHTYTHTHTHTHTHTQIIFGLAVLYPLAGPYMYMYMLKQRKKRVGGGGGKKAAAGEKKTK